MEYKIIFGSMLATVEDEVNAAADDGWKPHGSLVYSDKYIQPMTREGFYYTKMVEEGEKELAE